MIVSWYFGLVDLGSSIALWMWYLIIDSPNLLAPSSWSRFWQLCIVRITFVWWELNSFQPITCSMFSLFTTIIMKYFVFSLTAQKRPASLKTGPENRIHLSALSHVLLLVILTRLMTRLFWFRMDAWSFFSSLLAEGGNVHAFWFSLLCHKWNRGYLNPGSCPVILLYTLGRLTKNPTTNSRLQLQNFPWSSSLPYMAKLGLPIVNP